MAAEPKDLVVGILGASGTLAGLLLVFGGFLFSQAASFPPETPDNVTSKFSKAGRFATWPFIGFLLSTMLCVVWLLYSECWLYWLDVIVFLVSVVATGIYGVAAAYRYL